MCVTLCNKIHWPGSAEWEDASNPSRQKPCLILSAHMGCRQRLFVANLSNFLMFLYSCITYNTFSWILDQLSLREFFQKQYCSSPAVSDSWEQSNRKDWNLRHGEISQGLVPQPGQVFSHPGTALLSPWPISSSLACCPHWGGQKYMRNFSSVVDIWVKRLPHGCHTHCCLVYSNLITL